jgi:hypothetical protein
MATSSSIVDDDDDDDPSSDHHQGLPILGDHGPGVWGAWWNVSSWTMNSFHL